MTRLKERDDQAVALRREVAALADTSSSPRAMQHRLAEMMRRAVDDISEMQAGARAEADALIKEAEAESEALRRQHEESLSEMTARLEAMEAVHEEAKNKLDAELTS